MKNIKKDILFLLSTVTLISTQLQAGGDISEVVFEEYDMLQAEVSTDIEPYLEPIVIEELKKAVAVKTPLIVVPPVHEKKFIEKRKNPFYVGLGLSAEQANTYNFDKDKMLAIGGRVGYDFFKYLGVELRGSKSINREDHFTHDYSLGAYVKPQYFLNDDSTIYGLIGYGQTKLTFENEVRLNGISNNYTTQNGLSLGLGVEYEFMDNWSLFTDAIRLIDKETTTVEGTYAIKVDSVTLGLVKRF